MCAIEKCVRAAQSDGDGAGDEEADVLDSAGWPSESGLSSSPVSSLSRIAAIGSRSLLVARSSRVRSAIRRRVSRRARRSSWRRCLRSRRSSSRRVISSGSIGSPLHVSGCALWAGRPGPFRVFSHLRYLALFNDHIICELYTLKYVQ